MKRRTFMRGTGAAALTPAVASVAGAASNASSPPNVVLIVADDLGYGDLGCYGSQIKTPNLDKMAMQGVQFSQFYSANPVCSPSRASILTGRYGVRCNVPTVFQAADTGGMSETEVTIAQMLKRLNYATMCVGKWHLGTAPQYLPTARGFDEYYGIPYSNDMIPSILMHNAQVIESPVDLPTLTSRYTDQAISFIQRNRTKPFFLYMPHTFPHIPLAASPAFAGKSGMGIYGDTVQELDWSVGQVLQALADNGVDDNTLVLFTSDNGPWFQGSPGRLRGRKGDTFEGGMREPFLARFPSRISSDVGPRKPVKRVVDAMATTLDLLPTIAAFTGAALPSAPLDGVDISTLLTGEATTVTRDVFLYFSGWDLQCARMGPWKLHMTRANTPPYTPEPKIGNFNLPLVNPELYNVESDPEEADDVSAQNPDIVAQIQRRVNQLMITLPIQVQTAWNYTSSLKAYPNTPGSWPILIWPQ